MMEWAFAIGLIVGLPVGAVVLGVVLGRRLANKDFPLEDPKRPGR